MLCSTVLSQERKSQYAVRLKGANSDGTNLGLGVMRVIFSSWLKEVLRFLHNS